MSVTIKQKGDNMESVQVGSIFGEWKVLRPIEDPEARPHGRHYFLCECSCGVESQVYEYNLLRGYSTRCRKCADDVIGSKNKVEFPKKSRLYRSWERAKLRDDFIWSSAEWKQNYSSFCQDLKDAGILDQSKKMQPIDVEAPISIENIELVSDLRRGRKFLTVQGRSYSTQELTDILGISRQRIFQIREHFGNDDELRRRVKEALNNEKGKESRG